MVPEPGLCLTVTTSFHRRSSFRFQADRVKWLYPPHAAVFWVSGASGACPLSPARPADESLACLLLTDSSGGRHWEDRRGCGKPHGCNTGAIRLAPQTHPKHACTRTCARTHTHTRKNTNAHFETHLEDAAGFKHTAFSNPRFSSCSNIQPSSNTYLHFLTLGQMHYLHISVLKGGFVRKPRRHQP